jgi:uncharacterized OB-fold protein
VRRLPEPHLVPACHLPGNLQPAYQLAGGFRPGTVYSYTVNYRGEGAYRDRGPYVLAYVELDEGPRMMTNIVDAGDTGVAVGMPVEMVFHDTGEGSALPRFRPVAAREAQHI